MKNTDILPCKFGASCYRKNPDHFQNFSHPPPASKSPKEERSPRRKHGIVSLSTKESVSSMATSPISPRKKNKITDFFSLKNRSVVEDLASRKRKTDSDDTTTEKVARVEPSKLMTLVLPDDVKEWIHSTFFLKVSDDFFSLWRYCCLKSAANPSEALVCSFGLHLVGPYDLLSNKIDRSSSFTDACLHWRYYYDPPEMVTVLAELDATDKEHLKKLSSSGFHIGYFRDDPDQEPAFLVWNNAGESGNLLVKGDNLFATLRLLAEENIRQKKCDERLLRRELNAMSAFLADNNLNFSMDVVSKPMKVREKKVVTKTFHGAGLVVPVVNDVGYRPLPKTTAGLKKILTKIVAAKSQNEKIKAMEPLQEIVTLCQFANDEGDFGEGIELGLDLFTFGSEALHSTISHLLPLGYRLANREKFAEVIEKHLANRGTLSDIIDCTKIKSKLAD